MSQPNGAVRELVTDTVRGTVTEQEIRHVLWWWAHRGGAPRRYAAGGHEPGSFTTRLLEAIAAADPINRARLAQGFAGYVFAFTLGEEEDGDEVLRRLAGITLCDRCGGDGLQHAAQPPLISGAAAFIERCERCHGAGTL